MAVEAHWATVAPLKPGNTCGDVFAAYARVCDKRGMGKHRHTATGYSMGAVIGMSFLNHSDLAGAVRAGRSMVSRTLTTGLRR